METDADSFRGKPFGELKKILRKCHCVEISKINLLRVLYILHNDEVQVQLQVLLLVPVDCHVSGTCTCPGGCTG